jgi:drug/metabolite transporter (DMT)-like permease
LNNTRGAILMVLAMAGFAIEDMFIKLAADSLPVGQILMIIGIGGALAYGGYALARGLAPVSLSMLRGASGIRAVFEGVAAICFVTGLSLVPISVVTTIIQANPLLVTIGAALIFRETIGWRRWSAIAVGLIGVLIVVRPFGAGFAGGTLFVVAGVVAMSARDLATRKIPARFSTVQLSTLGFLATIPAGAVAMLIEGGGFVMPDLRATACLAGAIAIGIPALYCIIAAMRVGEISFVAPFRYSRIVFGLFAGVLVFRETLDGYTILGAAIITAAGLYTFLREARLRRAFPQPSTAI